MRLVGGCDPGLVQLPGGRWCLAPRPEEAEAMARRSAQATERPPDLPVVPSTPPEAPMPPLRLLVRPPGERVPRSSRVRTAWCSECKAQYTEPVKPGTPSPLCPEHRRIRARLRLGRPV